MDNARRKIRVCLICVVMAAVIVGFIYYFNDVRSQGDMTEGTLVQMEMSDDDNIAESRKEVWQQTARQYISKQTETWRSLSQKSRLAM